jgi:hypothetical protein
MTVWPEQELKSLQALQRLSKDADATWPNANQCLFRGQSSAAWSLQPSLARELEGSSLKWFQIARLERDLATRFHREAHRELPPAVLSAKDYLLDWWPLMRHYGVPTRLLDWSLSPYVALYFAVAQRWDEDGALWWFKASTLENLMAGRTFGAAYNDASRSLFQSPDDDGVLVSADPPKMLFVYELKRSIERIGNQQGRFTFCLDPKVDHADVIAELDGYADGPHLGKLVVPKALKAQLLRELQLMNVTGKSMFPGLDGLGMTLAELTRLSVRFGGP